MIALVHQLQQSNILDFPPTVIGQGKSNEWYTPSRYIEAARSVMGSIDLDPASCELANRTVKAKRYFTERDNGLAHEWFGNVWMNPPYGRENGSGASIIQKFVLKLFDAYRIGNVSQAIALLTVRTDAAWFRQLWEHTICFTDHRLHFGKPSKGDIEIDSRWGHFFGTCFVYLGPNEQAFISTFEQFGTIAKRVSTPRHTVSTPSLWEVQS